MQHYVVYFHLWQNLAYKVKAQGDYFDDYAFSKLDNRGKMYLLPSVCAKKEKKSPASFPSSQKIFLHFAKVFIVHKMPGNRGLIPRTLCEMNVIFTLDHRKGRKLGPSLYYVHT